MIANSRLIDLDGKPLVYELPSYTPSPRKSRKVKAKYDAAQTFTGNSEHWKNADNLSPHSSNAPEVRRKLRSRSRYEVIENNPYLNGTVISLCNDFVGQTAPRVKIVDKRVSTKQVQAIMEQWNIWASEIGLREKIWRLRIGKITDGESFATAYTNETRTSNLSPILLDIYPFEPEKVADPRNHDFSTTGVFEGIRIDPYENPIEYYVYDNYPDFQPYRMNKDGYYTGRWVDSRFVVHWLRKTRGWIRGIPELTPSLPLCALLRRYVLAVLENGEAVASQSILLESEFSPIAPFSGGIPPKPSATSSETSAFSTIPIERNMMTILPTGMKSSQLSNVPIGVDYNDYIGALLREIMRPILVPYNIATGSSKDSNMASAIVDSDMYRQGQMSERSSCEQYVLSKIFHLWWREAALIHQESRIFGRADLDPSLLEDGYCPIHKWMWDKIGEDHTDPVKVANAIKILHDKRFIGDEYVQETYFNRTRDQWASDIKEDDNIRKSLEYNGMKDAETPEVSQISPKEDKPQSKPTKASRKKTTRKKPKTKYSVPTI